MKFKEITKQVTPKIIKDFADLIKNKMNEPLVLITRKESIQKNPDLEYFIFPDLTPKNEKILIKKVGSILGIKITSWNSMYDLQDISKTLINYK